MYHRVVPTVEAGNSAPDLVVSPATFSAQLRALRDAGWQSITMATLEDDMATDETIPARTFVITFDDGWSDGYEYAFPIMREYGFVGTYFVIGSRIDQKDFLSTTEMQALEAAGNEIGNHTENHVSLSSVTMSHVRQEVEDASAAIARAVGHRPVSLAYPMGGVSAGVAQVLSQTPDIKVAVMTQPSGPESWFARYYMPRVRVHPNTNPEKLVASLN
jgi:peptidoglycan/xylan/chitin deacetylase (PgdA/CDA1 family)